MNEERCTKQFHMINRQAYARRFLYTQRRLISSYIYGTLEDAQALVNRYHGTGDALFDRNGNWKNKEIVAFGNDIGVCLDINGASEITNAFVIHYGKKGTHIVPAARKE